MSVFFFLIYRGEVLNQGGSLFYTYKIDNNAKENKQTKNCSHHH